MLRIDEIYTTHLVPWLQQHQQDLRCLWFDPFGRTDIDAVQCKTRGLQEQDYVIFFDQEPVQADLHNATFDHIQQKRCFDIHWHAKHAVGHIITSEYASESVEQICRDRDWQSHYYFFHGWAALDWYRGYNLVPTITFPEQRSISCTFVNPNRIVGGRRNHRLQLLYWIFKYGLLDNYISCPAVCPVENQPIQDLVKSFESDYPDISQVFDRVTLPLDMPGESGHPMTSAHLDLFEPCAQSLLYLVTETLADGRRQHLTEKTFKPICLQMPFVLVATQGALEYLRGYGFQTFNSIWDESYDLEPNMTRRIAKIGKLLSDLDKLSTNEKQNLYKSAIPIIKHNYEHFYGGGFEAVLWKEMTQMIQEFDHGI